MKHAAPVRRELAARTVFNVLGPLTNPAGARAQVVGVYAPGSCRTFAEALVKLGARRAFVVHGAGGIDELSPAGPNLVCEVDDGEVRERELDPLRARARRAATPTSCAAAAAERERAGASATSSTAANRRPRRSAVLLNAAGAIAARRPRGRPREGLGDRPRGGRLRRGRGAPRPADRVLRRSGVCVRFKDALAAPGLRRDRGVQAALAVGRRPAARTATSPQVARDYERPGARAMSVLVDERFAGTWDDLRAARAATALPLLAKGFFSTPETSAPRARQAPTRRCSSCATSTTRPAALMREAAALGLDTLVEAHDAEELERATALGAPVIGVNARDLSDLRDRPPRPARAARPAPRDRIVVAESASPRALRARPPSSPGANAMLVGSTLMRAPDPGRSSPS